MIEKARAYTKDYVKTTIKAHSYLFHMFMQNQEYDTFSMIDTYMRTSDIRKRIDQGNWIALNKSSKQMYNDIDLSLCKGKGNSFQPDEIMLDWMAHIYVLLQWRYMIPSKEISEKLPAYELALSYTPLNEASYQNACEKLYQKYLSAKTSNRILEFRDDNYYLSNFYEAPVTYDGITYQNNEAAFQAQKVLGAARLEFAKLNPTEAKKLGRTVRLRSDWEDIKINVMKEIVRAKFEQNSELAEKLLATGDSYLEEGNDWGDRIWGTVNGHGANHLGRILMEIREDLRMKEKDISMER